MHAGAASGHSRTLSGHNHSTYEKFYLDGGIVKNLLDRDSLAMDGVPENSLGGEHQVAEFQVEEKKAPTAAIDTVGSQQIDANSPYLRNVKKRNRKELNELHNFARKDPREKMAKQLFQHSIAEGCQNHFRKLKIMKDQQPLFKS